MFALNLQLVLSFLIHCAKRYFCGVVNLIRRKSISPEENVFKDERYILQYKDKTYSYLIGDVELEGYIKIVGLKNIKEPRFSYYYKSKSFCSMAELEANELNIQYDGSLRFLNMNPTFRMIAVLNNVNIQFEFKIYPRERVTFYLEKVEIEELKIKVNVPGVKVISWIIESIVNISLNLMSFIIRCFLEFYIRSYLNETSTNFLLSQYDLFEIAVRKMKRANDLPSSLEPSLDVEIKKQRSDGRTTFIYDLMTYMFKFNKIISQVAIAEVIGKNSEDDPSDTESDESESDSSSETAIADIEIQKRIGVDNSVADSNATENDLNNGALSSQDDSENEADTPSSVQNSKIEGEGSKAKTVSQSKTVPLDWSNLHLEESCKQKEASRDERGFQSEDESSTENESDSSESDCYEEKRYLKYLKTEDCREESRCEKKFSSDNVTVQQEDSSSGNDAVQPKSNSNDNVAIVPKSILNENTLLRYDRCRIKPYPCI